MTTGGPQPRSLGDERFIEALAAPGCPMCTHADRRGRDHLFAVLYELVTDVGFRARLVEAGGFCPRHTRWALSVDRAEIGGVTAAAILLRSVLNARRGALAEVGRRRPGDRIARATGEAWSCPVCEQEQIVVDDAAARLVEHASRDAAWRTVLEESAWCLGHVGSIAKAAAHRDAGLRAAFLAAQAARIGALDARLAGLVDHSSHDRLTELTPSEQASADDVVAFLAGSRRP